MGGDAQNFEFGGKAGERRSVEQAIVHGGADIAEDAAGENFYQAGATSVAAAGNAGDALIFAEGGFYVEANPVDQRQHLCEAPGIGAGAVKADAEAEGTDLLDGGGQGRLQGWLAAGKDDAV